MAKVQRNTTDEDIDAIIQRAAERGETLTPMDVKLQRRVSTGGIPSRTAEEADEIIDRALATRAKARTKPGETFRGRLAGQEGPTRGGTEFIEFRDFAGEKEFRIDRAEETRLEIADQRAKSQKLAARLGAKKQIDTERTVIEYSPYQERLLSSIETARANVEKDVSEQRLTPEQAEKFTDQLDVRANMVIPGPRRRPPTPQEQYESRKFRDPNTGVEMYLDGKGEPKLPPSTPTNKELFDIRKSIMDNATEDLTSEQVNALIASAVQGNVQVRNILSGGQGGGQQELRGGRVGLQQKLIDIRKQGKAEGMSDEAIEAAIQRAETDRPIGTVDPNEGFVEWDELSPDEQEEILVKFRKEEAKKQRSTTTLGTGARPSITTPSRFKPQTEEQFIQSVRDNPSLLRKFTKTRKKGALPATWEGATPKERAAMYALYKDTVKAGGRVRSFGEFKKLIIANPDRIPEFSKSKKKK